jgi:deazaflavin-dependent oxidoreductase (nitroreductase family)
MKFFFLITFRIMVWLYRLTGGRFGGQVQGLPVLLLTTTGRRSGKQRVAPLGYFEHEGAYVVTASNAGFDPNPGWYHNLKNKPQVMLQIRRKRLPALAEEAGPQLRKELWEKLVALAPGYRAYQTRTTREIPIILLKPAPAV